ncbi:histidine kinase dimerization/phospho-acceptor domain-containing protein [Rhodoblastus sp. 17X3]|uniref:ATP-binding protein n=1 Tax=Rhodoblastus sp. 17X3 TaxID=3047026 RepID=UPI0024B6CBC3|nr:ATP-binding protein [Rhodoblastus sp. 17X3]MDI9848538.1 histidine kinase dimerization/phospho-acceptor domain-containing protein [Rhodoblastus sp. 17X3]
MADNIANGRQSAEVAAALADPAVASLARAGAPVLVAGGDPARVIYANDSALALFGASDCGALTPKLFGSDLPGSLRLAELARSILPGAAARLERLSFIGADLPGAITALCRRTAGDPSLFVLAGLGLRAGRLRARPAAAPQAAASHAEPHPAVSDETVAVDGLGAIRAQLQTRFPGLAPARFLWRTDSRNIVLQVTPPLAEIVGPGCADLVGRDLIEAAETLGFDPSGELAEALRAQATFSRVDVDWPIAGASAAAPVTLGALPVFDHGAHFEGWRGFGVIHLDRLRQAPFVAGLFQAQDASAPDEPPAREEPASGDSFLSEHPPSKAEPTETAPSEPAPSEPAPAEMAPIGIWPPEFSGVVVPLRPLAHGRPVTSGEPAEYSGGAEPNGASARDGEDAESSLVTLAPHERSAFREIARALGARGPLEAGDEAPVAPPASPPATPSASWPAEPQETVEPPASPEAVEVRPAEKFDALFAEALPVGLVASRGATLLYANRLALDWLGYADLAAFSAAGGLRASSRFVAAELAPGQKRTLLLRGANGEAISADAHCARVDWDGGPADLVTLIRPSATALEQRVGVIEASLRQRESEIDEIQSMVDAAADGVVLINADGAILGLDRAAEALLDYDRNQVAGENFTILLARESHVSALEYFTRAKAGAEKRGREAIGRTRQGATTPLHLTIGRLGKTVEGKYCLILRDMSHWRQSERAMDEARARAERDSQAKSEFLAKVSHEIRTPLNAILGFAEVIMDERFGPVGNERYKDYLRDIHSSGAHVMSLVNDLLDLSKIEAGKLDLSVVAVDANRVVAECVSLIQPQANREKVITRLALATRLPPIHADERSLRQIVLNLLANAVRYNEPGGQVIVSTALSDSGHAVLRVKDTGIGMTESELGAALEPFRQVAPSRGGTGLGLPLTKALAEANGAGFSIKSRKNEGTLVEVVFPLAPGAEQVSAGGGKR